MMKIRFYTSVGSRISYKSFLLFSFNILLRSFAFPFLIIINSKGKIGLYKRNIWCTYHSYNSPPTVTLFSRISCTVSSNMKAATRSRIILVCSRLEPQQGQDGSRSSGSVIQPRLRTSKLSKMYYRRHASQFPRKRNMKFVKYICM